MQVCDHPNMKDTARRDWCPDCGYEYYHGDAHSPDPEARISKLVNPGRDARAIELEGPCDHT